MLQDVEKEIADDKNSQMEKIAKSFVLNQDVMLSEKSIGQQFWSGPGKINRIKKNQIEVQFDPKKKLITTLIDFAPSLTFKKKGTGTS